MAYNSYFANVIIRLVFLLGSFIGVAYLLVNTDRFFTMGFLLLLSIIQIISLVYFLNRTNRDLARFLLLLTEEDTSVIAWKDRVEKTFRGLHHSFEKVNKEILRYRMEKEKGSILLQNVIDHIKTGILVVDEEGTMRLVNSEALHMFDLNSIHTQEDLDHFQEGLAGEFTKLRHDSGNILHVGPAGGDRIPVLVRVSALKLGEHKLRLYSIQGIKNELEANEIESWQKLTRVLAHEISNSVTPIATLGSGIHRKLGLAEKDQKGGMQLTSGVSIDLLKSSELIEKRSNSLVEFMEHYKSFTSLPEPVPQKIEVSAFFEALRLLFRDELKVHHIKFDFQLEDPGLSLEADRGLLEQTFINLIRNSLEALEGREEGCITIHVSQLEDKVVVAFSDNGPGIPADIQPQVFIPFFTTKPGGSGIGMSIVRKIIIMNGGSIELMSKHSQGAGFMIKLPAPDMA
jgi:nitrogen fixation/metabolism regulation signal transduction histidine kinase